MPTPRSVSSIKSNLLRPALTSHFEVNIAFPDSIRRYLGVNQDKLNLMCSDASLPGSQLATMDINNDRTGVTEKHAYRRMFDDRIDLTFYVDAQNYLPIKFFEAWIRYITDEDDEAENKGVNSLDPSYFYRMRYPDEYIATGLRVIKFERDYKNSLIYEFVRSFPLSISSMPISYEGSSLLKCTVSMSYIRYVILPKQKSNTVNQSPSPLEQASFNDAPSYFTNPEFGVSTTTGGVSQQNANNSGNSITLTGQDYTRRRQGLD